MSKELLNIRGVGRVTEDDLQGMRMFSSNKPQIEQWVKDIKCSNYKPCPICNKCMVKACHLHEQCNRCKVPLCVHDAKSREKLIKPINFTLETDETFAPEIMESLRLTIEEYDNKMEDK